MNEWVHIDLFSGAGGFALGLDRAGFDFVHRYYSEIDAHAIANYSYNFKNTEYVGTVENVSGTEIRNRHIGQKIIVTFGFPCQDLSVAGKGEGFNGTRSSLFFEAVRVVKEARPEVFIFENVEGLLTNNEGKTFEIVLRTIADLGLYVCEWQLVNTRWLLPQNRERIYFVGHLGEGSGPKVFPFTEADFRFNEGKSKTAVSRTFTAGGHSGGHHSGMTLITNIQGNEISNTIRTGGRGSKTMKHNWDMVNVPMRWQRSELGKESRRNSKKDGKDYTPFSGGNRELVPSNDTASGCITNALNKDALIGTYKENYMQWDSSGKGYNSQQDRAFYENGNMGTIPSCRTENKINVLTNDLNIRRLTEIECERLQGFTDSWTKYGNYNGTIKQISSTQRYKLMGNAVSVCWPELIGKRLLK